MPHTMVTFRLHRSGVILLAIFGVVLAVLIFAAGVLTARFWTSAPPRPKVGGLKPRPTPTVNRQPPTSPAPKENLTLRVAVLTSEEDAKTQLASLTAMGLKPSTIQMPTTSGVTLYTIVVGHFETRAAANAAAKELQSRLGFLPVVIPAPLPTNL